MPERLEHILLPVSLELSSYGPAVPWSGGEPLDTSKSQA